MQLNLFGDEPVEAPIIAPINDVVSTPKKYKLVPPTNIVLDSDNQQSQNNIQKEKINTQKKGTVQKVKKEKAVSIKSNVLTEIISEPVKKKEPKIRTIIALDLFAEIIPEQIKTHIPEAISASILEVNPDTISKIIHQEIPEEISEEIEEIISKISREDTSERISKITNENIQEATSESISEVIPVNVTEKTTNTFPAQESTPISAKSSSEVKEKYVLRVPNVIKIEETEPKKEIEKVAVTEVKPTKIKEVENIILPELIEKTDLDIPPSIIVDEEELSVKSSKGRSSVSQFHADLLLINIPDDDVLFTKQYYPISEVATMFNVKVSLLRFWENEFDILKPRKNRKGDRLFRPEDVKSLKLIYFLLREKKYTIEGAKIFIKKGKNVKEKFAAIESLKKIKGMLMELKAGLSF